jgi:hypothetical protein
MRRLFLVAALLAGTAPHASADVCGSPSTTATLRPKIAPVPKPPVKADADIPLPQLDVPFVPAPEGPERLKGIGLLRQCLGTN